MKIIYKYGDIFGSQEKVLIHGCNAKGVMGSGIAKLMRKKHPIAFQAYLDVYKVNKLTLGEIIWAETKGLLIGNAITQERFGFDKQTVYVNYDAVRNVIKKVNEKVTDIYQTVGMPQIGSGLAHGDWKIISNIIEEESKDFTPIVYINDLWIYSSLIQSY